VTTEPSGCRRGTRVLLYLLGSRAGWCFHTHRRNKRRASREPRRAFAAPPPALYNSRPKTVSLVFSHGSARYLRGRARIYRYQGEQGDTRYTDPNITNRQMIGARVRFISNARACPARSRRVKRESVIIDGNDKILLPAACA